MKTLSVEQIQLQAAQLIRNATLAGVVVKIDTVALKPLAMQNYEMVAEVYPRQAANCKPERGPRHFRHVLDVNVDVAGCVELRTDGTIWGPSVDKSERRPIPQISRADVVRFVERGHWVEIEAAK